MAQEQQMYDEQEDNQQQQQMNNNMNDMNDMNNNNNMQQQNDQNEVKQDLKKSDQFETNWDKVVESFDHMNLREDLLRGIYSYGFEKPSAIQQRGILPVIQSFVNKLNLNLLRNIAIS